MADGVQTGAGANGLDALNQHGNANTLQRTAHLVTNGNGTHHGQNVSGHILAQNFSSSDSQLLSENLHISGGGTANGTESSENKTLEQELAEKSALKTRISELEVINTLYRGRLEQLESELAQWKRIALSHQPSLQGHEGDQLDAELTSMTAPREEGNDVRMEEGAPDGRVDEHPTFGIDDVQVDPAMSFAPRPEDEGANTGHHHELHGTQQPADSHQLSDIDPRLQGESSEIGQISQEMNGEPPRKRMRSEGPENLSLPEAPAESDSNLSLMATAASAVKESSGISEPSEIDKDH